VTEAAESVTIGAVGAAIVVVVLDGCPGLPAAAGTEVVASSSPELGGFVSFVVGLDVDGVPPPPGSLGPVPVTPEGTVVVVDDVDEPCSDEPSPVTPVAGSVVVVEAPAEPGELTPVVPGELVPVVSGELVPGELTPVVPGELVPVVPGKLVPVVPDEPGELVPVVPDEPGPGEPGELVPVVPSAPVPPLRRLDRSLGNRTSSSSSGVEGSPASLLLGDPVDPPGSEPPGSESPGLSDPDPIAVVTVAVVAAGQSRRSSATSWPRASERASSSVDTSPSASSRVAADWLLSRLLAFERARSSSATLVSADCTVCWSEVTSLVGAPLGMSTS
jgi:hypothetical protein